MTTIRDLLDSGKITPDTVVLGELPMTADGAVAVYGCELWTSDIVPQYPWIFGVSIMRSKACYSTRAAAEAARSNA